MNPKKIYEVKKDFKLFCSKAGKGKDVIINRKNKPNVVIISQEKYDSLLKAKQQLDDITLISSPKEIIEHESSLPIKKVRKPSKRKQTTNTTTTKRTRTATAKIANKS